MKQHTVGLVVLIACTLFIAQYARLMADNSLFVQNPITRVFPAIAAAGLILGALMMIVDKEQPHQRRRCS